MFESVYDNLNDKQREAVEYDKGPLLIIAGAGTGKTSVVTARIAYLIEQKKLDPDALLALTFTDKAAGEMEERVDLLLPLGYTDLWIHTFHGFCERVLRMHALDVGLPADFELADDIEQRLIVKRHFYDFEFDYYKPQGSPDSLVSALISHFSRAKDEDITPEQYLEYAQKVSKQKGVEVDEKLRVMEIAKAYEQYQQILISENKLDFGDLIFYTLQLFRKQKNILKQYQEQFQYVLVDEFQDTNYAQYQLVKMLVSDDSNITVCADDDQSIYKWRGASVSNVLQFRDDFPKTKQVVLTQNYRSTQEILDLSYISIQHNNPDRLEARNNIEKKLISHAGSGERPKHGHFATVEEENRFVVNTIISGVNDGGRWSDYAVLVRSNADAEDFIQLFTQKNIPFDFVASRGLYTKPEVVDLLSVLKLIVHYHDDAAFYRVITLPVFALGYKDITPLLDEARRTNQSFFDVFLNHNDVSGIAEDVRRRIDGVMDLLEQLAVLAHSKDVGEVLLSFLEESGYLREMQHGDASDTEKKMLNISLLFKRIQQFQVQQKGVSLTKDFIEELEMKRDIGEDPAPGKSEEGPDSVTIMTIHGSKGLEFDTVFVVHMIQGRFPVRNRREAISLPEEMVEEVIPEGDPHIQEERRLFYVAMTRAQKQLYITSADDYGGVRKRKMSVFVQEIKEELENVGPVSFEESDVFGNDVVEPVQKLVKATFELPKKLSYTQIAAFENCPKQYKYRHILGIQGKGGFAKSYGNSLHNALASFYQEIIDARQKSLFDDSQAGTLDRLMELYEDHWIPYYYHGKKHETQKKEEGKAALEKYFAENKDDFSKVLLVEKPFNVRVGEYTFKGVIDRMDDLGDGKVEIIDYKTGKLRTQKQVDKDTQLSLYALAAKQVFGYECEAVSLYFLNDGEKVSSVRGQMEIDLFVDEVSGVAEDMKVSDFKATAGFQCRFCDYYGICEDRAKV